MADIIVEVTGAGGATNLQALTDVDLTGTVDGQVLTYDSGTLKWIPTAAAGVDTIAALTDTNTTGVADGYILEYDTGTSTWVAVANAGGAAPVDSVAGKTGVVTLAKADITDFVETDYATGAEGDLATSALQDITAEAIGALANVDETGKVNGSILKYNGTTWVVGTDVTEGGTTALNDLSDVTLTASATGEVLRYNGTAWVDQALVKSDISDFVETDYATGAEGDLATSATQPGDNISTLTNDLGFTNDQTGAEIKVAYEAEANTNAFTDANVTTLSTALQNITNESINDLSDVDLTTVAIANGDLIQWNSTGSKFIPVSPLDLPQPAAAPADISASSIDDLSDVFANEYTDGMVLRANGLVFHDSFLDYSDLTGTPTITDWTVGSQGTIDSTNLPGLALTDINTVADETAQLALTAQEGDVAIRTDLNKTYAHNGGVAGTMADWSELLTPTDIVTSVAGKTGVVTLSKADITDFVETDYATGAEGDLATSALQDIVTDTTPQLGGDLDTNGFAIAGQKYYNPTVQTTDATVTTAQTISIASGGVATYTLQGMGTEPATGDTYGFTLSGCIKNVAGVTSIVGSNLLTKFQDAGASAWTITATANDTTDNLEIKVTGEAARTINWNYTMKTVEV